MRNIVYKNLTSANRKRRMISSCEVMEKQGMRTTIRRHFVYKATEINDILKQKPLPQVYIRRVCNQNQQQESFFCRMKASLYARSKGRLFLILFGHSLKIESKPIVTIIV